MTPPPLSPMPDALFATYLGMNVKDKIKMCIKEAF